MRPQRKHQVGDAFPWVGAPFKVWRAYRQPRRAGAIMRGRRVELPWVLRPRLHLPKAEGRRKG